MKILLIIDVVDNGGVGIVMRNMLNHLDNKKYNVDILTFEENREYEKYITKSVRIIHAYKKNPAKSHNRIVRYVYGVIKEIIPSWYVRKHFSLDDYDIVIDFKGNNLNVLTSAKCKKVYWCHKDFSPDTNLVERDNIENYSRTLNGRFKEKSYIKRIGMLDYVVCISDYTRDAFIKRWNYKKPVKVVHNVIDSKTIVARSQEKIDYHRNTDTITFCCLSRISKGKGIERLLDCVKRLNAEKYDFFLNIVGGGDGFQDVKRLFESMNLSNVRLWGNQDNPYPYLRECDIFVCPSETEAYCTVLCEAIVLGKPIIMTDVGASKEIMSKGTFGLLVENTEDGILEGMKSYLNNPTSIKQYSHDCLHEESPFSIDASMNEVEDLFDEIYR